MGNMKSKLVKKSKAEIVYPVAQVIPQFYEIEINNYISTNIPLVEKIKTLIDKYLLTIEYNDFRYFISNFSSEILFSKLRESNYYFYQLKLLCGQICNEEKSEIHNYIFINYKDKINWNNHCMVKKLLELFECSFRMCSIRMILESNNEKLVTMHTLQSIFDNINLYIDQPRQEPMSLEEIEKYINILTPTKLRECDEYKLHEIFQTYQMHLRHNSKFVYMFFFSTDDERKETFCKNLEIDTLFLENFKSNDDYLLEGHDSQIVYDNIHEIYMKKNRKLIESYTHLCHKSYIVDPSTILI